ncbi:MAG TPA: helix-turn-helix domain-containing protein [Mycobacteriales bacterium]|nr:helix-turn-helix domain-containing protein [Mycobacteriales bacterium]
MTVNESPRKGDIQSVHRALDLLELIGRRGDLGVSEMARETGLAVSTVHNLLRTLARRNYLISDGGRYRLGPGVMVLKSQWDPVTSLSTLLRPVLQRLTVLTGHAATATALLGHDARLIGFDPGPSPVTVSSSQWTWKNPLALATGRILVAMTQEPDWDDFIAAGKDAEPDWSRRRWREELSTVARTGTSVKAARHDQDAVGVAVPVWSSGSSVVCSIGCSAPGFLATDDVIRDMLRALWTVSAEISARLGCESIPRQH